MVNDDGRGIPRTAPTANTRGVGWPPDVAAYGRTVQRCLLLILIASAPSLIGERPQSWDVLTGAGALAHVAAFLKFDARSIVAIIGITSPWILPMVGRSARVRGAFLLGSVAAHALLCQFFYGLRGVSLCFWFSVAQLYTLR
jgi:hypothetical protein